MEAEEAMIFFFIFCLLFAVSVGIVFGIVIADSTPHIKTSTRNDHAKKTD